ncbi:MAG TPA: hypothetical protein VIE12_12655 [Actinomycetota bacterium]
MTVVFVDPDPNGLAEVVGELIRQNLERDPARHRLLVPTVATIVVPDADVGMTIRVDPPRVEIANALAPVATLRVRAGSRSLLRLTATPLRFGLPDPFSHGGREVLADLVSRRTRVGGLLRHPILTARLAMLLSVA